jgi:TRAP transporter 4TM/12TM fusion protein
MNRFAALARDLCLAAIPLLGALWLLDLPQRFGAAILGASYLSFMCGLAVAAGLLAQPYGKQPGALELLLALLALASWWYGAWFTEAWLMTAAERGAQKWIPAAVALLLAMEATRKYCGPSMTILVWAFIAYGIWGHHISGLFEATETPVNKLLLYLYNDVNGIPGQVLDVGATLVLGFMIMGKVMEKGGATQFFNDAALAAMGSRRGGAGKVEVVASSVFGSINGTVVGNIMGTGMITIPLMKSYGFKPHYAAAIEASSSNGGQIVPPVMGATAFLIAEYLQIPYKEVALAAILPAVVYYWAIFVQIDRYAENYGLAGIEKSKLPRLGAVMAAGWVFLLPLALLVYLLFWLGYNPGKSALITAGLLLVLNAIQRRRIQRLSELGDMLVSSGKDLAPLLVICAASGIIVGVLNITGLGLQFVNILVAVTAAAGLLVMLICAAIIAIILGIGMPTSAVYIVMAVVLAPALVRLGVVPIAAHFFLFYFGILSMLTPPVAIASYVAAGIAGADMWRTSWVALKFCASAYLMPFLFIYNPAILGQGTVVEIAVAAITAIMSAWVLAYAVEGSGRRPLEDLLRSAVLFAASIAIGAAPVFVKSIQPMALGDTAFDLRHVIAVLPALLAFAAIYFRKPKNKETLGVTP